MSKNLLYMIVILGIVVVGGGMYRKHEQLESVLKMCQSQFRDQIFCECMVDQLSESLPFYKAIDAYTWFSDTKSESKKMAENLAGSCGEPRTHTDSSK